MFGFFGCSQRDMIVYKLDSPLDGKKILQDIQNLIQSFRSSNGEIPLLIIDIKTIAYEDTGPIPKIEYKGE